MPTINLHTCCGVALVPSMFSLLKMLSVSLAVCVEHQAFVWMLVWILSDMILWKCNTGNILPMAKATCDIICRNHRPYILYQFTVAFKMILIVDKWFVIWEAVTVKMWGMWPTVEGRRIGSGLWMVEMRSVGELHCLSECRVTVYYAFTGVSLNITEVNLVYL